MSNLYVLKIFSLGESLSTSQMADGNHRPSFQSPKHITSTLIYIKDLFIDVYLPEHYIDFK